MQNLAIISGLIGALISAGLSYWIRAKLDRRNLRDAEVRLAYVYFVRISELMAFEVVCREFISKLSKTKEFEFFNALLSTELSVFETSHLASVIVAKALHELTPEKIKGTPTLSAIPIILKIQLESIRESKLSAEQLSKLPKDTILAYSLFLNFLSPLQAITALWISSFEEQNVSWVTAEKIHEQWRAIVVLFEHAHILHATLISAGIASASEASALLQKQIDTFSECLLAGTKHKLKLQSAETMMSVVEAIMTLAAAENKTTSELAKK